MKYSEGVAEVLTQWYAASRAEWRIHSGTLLYDQAVAGAEFKLDVGTLSTSLQVACRRETCRMVVFEAEIIHLLAKNCNPSKV